MSAATSDRRERLVWLGQSARTTVVTLTYPELGSARWMASLGDAIHRPRMLETVFGAHLKRRLAISGPLMLDSGGFTLMMHKRELSLAQVARAFIAVAAEVVVSLDYPPIGTDTAAMRRLKYDRALANFAALNREPIGAAVAPVVHGATPDELHANCEAIQRISPMPAWICLGGLVPVLRQCGQLGRLATQAQDRLRQTVSFVREFFPLSRLHVLGVGSPRTILTTFTSGADSADSIGWRRAAGFGTIFLPGGTERFVAHRARRRAASRLLLTEADHQILEQCDCPACVRAGNLEARLNTLAACYLARAAHNAWVLLGEARRPDTHHAQGV